ncbi:MAG: YceI family protein [Burkholderiales bacterium]|nr:YceI family protein [Burkholderiales bacterium]
MSLIHRIVLGAALAASVVAAPAAMAATKPAQLVPAGSEIDFTTKQMGVPVDGKFGRFTAQIVLDPKQPQTGSVAFEIDTGSARFGSAELDAEVPKPVWLNVVKFPQASFKSTAIKAAGPGRFEVTGVLSIKGLSHNVVVPVQLTQSGADSVASGSFTIKRLEFKVGEGEWSDTSMLADDVQVRFKLHLTGLAPL